MTNSNIPTVTRLLAFEPAALTIGPFGTDFSTTGSFNEHLAQATLVVSRSAGPDPAGTHPKPYEPCDDMRRATTDSPAEAYQRSSDTEHRPSEAADDGSEPKVASESASGSENDHAANTEGGQQGDCRGEEPGTDTDSKTSEETTAEGEVSSAGQVVEPETQASQAGLLEEVGDAGQGRAGESESHWPTSTQLNLESAAEETDLLAESQPASKTKRADAAPDGGDEQPAFKVMPAEEDPLSDQVNRGDGAPGLRQSQRGQTAREEILLGQGNGGVATQDKSQLAPPSTSGEAIAAQLRTGSESAAPAGDFAGGDQLETNGAVQGRAGDATTEAPANRDPSNEAKPGETPRVAAGRAGRPGSTTGTSSSEASESVDRARFVQRVARAFQSAANRGGSIRLRLHPPELGSLRLEMTVRGGVMTARVESETSAARSLLLDNLPALRERLGQYDIKVERFDVDLTDRSAGGSPREPGERPQSHDRSGAGAGSGRDNRTGDAAPPSRSETARRPGHGGALDVTI
jgi:flagellar hook-length control protein FliK